MTYRGESEGKKLQRPCFWQRARMTLGDERFFGRRHVVLASQHGGDIAELLSMGVRSDRIVACDRRTAAASKCHQRFPSVEVAVDDVGEVVERTRKVGVVHLDLCSTICRSTLALLDRVTLQPKRSLPMIVGLNVQFGRDPEVARHCRPEYPALDRASFLARHVAKATAREFVILGSEWYMGNRVPMLHVFFGRRQLRRAAARARVHRDDMCASLGGFADRAPDAAAIGVSSKTLAAWRAHTTRGTYG